MTEKTTEKSAITIGALLEISISAQPSAIFRVRESESTPGAIKRLPVVELSAAQFKNRFLESAEKNWLWAIPSAVCGDSLSQYHPKFAMALLSSLPIRSHNLNVRSFLDWQFPAIEFTTDEWTRRSMTLNGMRMSTEYFASDSPRVLQLIEQRLQTGQADVVHDVLVYLIQRVLELRTSMDEERALQAESLAAYLGLNALRAQELLFDWPLETDSIIQKIQGGFAGTPRPLDNISGLIENQLARFSVAFEELEFQQARVLRLIDEVVARFYNHSPNHNAH